MIVDMLRCYSLSSWPDEVRQAVRESFADTMEPGQSGVGSCSVNHWQKDRRETVCRTPKHFVWLACGSEIEARLSFCGL